jgi:HPt (histidine-containing phosphotransfer) domain-containing protein
LQRWIPLAHPDETMNRSLMQSRSCSHFSAEMFLKHSYNDSTIFEKLCMLFLQVGGEQFDRLESAVLAGDVVATSRECHALKGTLLIAGAHAATRILDSIDADFNREKSACTLARFLELRTEIMLTFDEVRCFLAVAALPIMEL